MQIIVSHNHLDFDGLASMVAARKLYPRAEMVFVGGLAGNVQRFMSLHKDSLPVRRIRDIKLSRVRRVVMVDTNSPRRLGELTEWFKHNSPEVHIYDHHPLAEDAPPASLLVRGEVGAATTLLVEKIQERSIKLSGFEATVLALGIYEDTGSLTFVSTTVRDVRAVAYLLECGANLEVVANFIELTLNDEQKTLFNHLLASVQHRTVNGLDVVIASAASPRSVGNLDFITHKLANLETFDLLLVAVQMEKRIYLVARSRSDNASAAEICAVWGGGGHLRAASATVKGKGLSDFLQELERVLPEKVHPPLTAKDIMSSPVKTISMHLSLEEAGNIMLRYGHTGLPVVEDGKLVGVISRRDIDKARIHGLEHLPVKGYMTRQVITARPDTPLPELQQLMVKHDIGRLPIIDENGELVGLVSRSDILRTYHGANYEDDHRLLFDAHTIDNGAVFVHGSNLQRLMQERVPGFFFRLLEEIGRLAEETGVGVYAVGGFVRDLLLGRTNLDLDLAVEGEGPEFARALAARYNGEIRVHERFGTAVVFLPDGLKIDVATARIEYYEYPAALPQVERAKLRHDLYRRDFTVNAMAIQLNAPRFGELIDFFGGCRDLGRGLIRVLYNMSFIEDPTRILRAVRFEQRYRFRMEPQTEQLMADALERGFLREVSGSRIRDEMVLILEEADPLAIIKRLAQLGVMEQILPEAELGRQTWRTLRRLPRVLEKIRSLGKRRKGSLLQPEVRKILRQAPGEIKPAAEANGLLPGTDTLKREAGEDEGEREFLPWLVYWLALFAETSETKAKEAVERLRFNRRAAQAVGQAYEVRARMQNLQNNSSSRLPMSAIHHVLAGVSLEVIAYLLARAATRTEERRLLRYLEIRGEEHPLLTGEDLKNMGLKPGPHFRVILDLLRDARLDRKVKTREEEVLLVQQWLKSQNQNKENKN